MSDLEQILRTNETLLDTKLMAESLIIVIMGDSKLKQEFLAIASSFKDEDIVVVGGKYKDWTLTELEDYESVEKDWTLSELEDCESVEDASDFPSRSLFFSAFLRSSIQNMPDGFWDKIAAYFRERQKEREESGVMW